MIDKITNLIYFYVSMCEFQSLVGSTSIFISVFKGFCFQSAQLNSVAHCLHFHPDFLGWKCSCKSFSTRQNKTEITYSVLSLPLIFPDPDQTEEGQECAHDGPSYHIPGVMLVICHPATGDNNSIHQSQDLDKI